MDAVPISMAGVLGRPVTGSIAGHSEMALCNGVAASAGPAFPMTVSLLKSGPTLAEKFAHAERSEVKGARRPQGAAQGLRTIDGPQRHLAGAHGGSGAEIAARANGTNARRAVGQPGAADEFGLAAGPSGRNKKTVMRTFAFARNAALSALVVAATLGVAAGGAMAFDEKVFDDKPASVEKSNPWKVFRFGFSAYKSGHKDQAVEAYRYAAENGQLGATWKLARMYAQGDGVARNDYEAFKFFTEIAQQDVEPGSPEESYVSDALLALGDYLKVGIPGSPVEPDMVAAQEYYMRAAANYRNPNAQFEIGKMFLRGDGGVKSSVRQAGRWLQLAAEKGHAGAQATLGNLLFESGKVVRGLAMMTAALERATPIDQPWIRGMQEEAFSLAGESDRRTAIALAADILKGASR